MKNTEEKISKEIIKKRDKYFLFAARPASIQRIDLLAKSFNKYLGAGTINMLYQNDDSAYFFSKNHFKKFSINLFNEIKDYKSVLRHLKRYYSLRDDILYLSKEVNNVKKEKQNLLKIFKKQQIILEKFSYYFVTTFGVDDYIFLKLQQKLKKVLFGDKYEKAMNVITSQTKIFGYQKYQLYLLNHKNNINYNYLIREYKWIKEYSYKEELLNKEMIDNDIDSLRNKEISLNIRSLKNRIRQNQNNLKNILDKIEDKNLRALAKLINEYINIKTDRIEVYKKLQSNFRIFFENITKIIQEKCLDFKYEYAISMTDKEIISFLTVNKDINLPILKKRFQQKFVSIYKNNKLEFIYNKQLIDTIRNAYLKVNNIELKGLIVSKGKVKGRARVIKSKKEFIKFKQGEILVCNFTTPDYIPIMNKAIGIITDDGGITCHAAIVSRELNKPCIVGTKSATRSFKTGDLLELDANQGIIKIIK